MQASTWLWLCAVVAFVCHCFVGNIGPLALSLLDGGLYQGATILIEDSVVSLNAVNHSAAGVSVEDRSQFSNATTIVLRRLAATGNTGVAVLLGCMHCPLALHVCIFMHTSWGLWAFWSERITGHAPEMGGEIAAEMGGVIAAEMGRNSSGDGA